VQSLRVAFAGDRDISVRVLKYLLGRDIRPLALLISDPGQESHADDLRALCSYLTSDLIFVGRAFRQPEAASILASLELDYIVSIHFPYIFPVETLSLPRFGVINLHPAYLPHNRGWHTPSWAILEDSPAGATLHFMDSGVDTGDIIHQKQLRASPGDTANTLYSRIKELEFEVFIEAWPQIESGTYKRQAQNPLQGSSHKRSDMLKPDIQRIDLEEQVQAGILLKRLRALTTNKIEESGYYEVDGKRYYVQLAIHEANTED
jgi:methionyl-tRNA formyltransferase